MGKCPKIPSLSSGSGIFVENVYLASGFSFIFGGVLGLVCENLATLATLLT